MRFPVVRERVRLQDRTGTFLVLSVDRLRGVANLISTAGGRVEERVSLSSILPLGGDATKDDKRTPKVK